MAVASTLLLTGASFTLRYLSRPPLSLQSSSLVTQEMQLPLPDKPSLVVLPFVNMSNDPAQEYFSDGMTEELTSTLAQLSSLFVIARNSAFTYHALLGHFYLFKKQHDQAIAEGERAILLDPNDAESYVWLGQIFNYSERPAEIIGLMEKAMRLNPHYPEYYPSILGFAYRLLGQYQEAIAAQQSALRRNPDFLAGHTVLAVLYSDLG